MAFELIRSGLMIFNRADYWRNVLSFDKTKNTCLILEELTEQELNDRMKNENKWLIKDKLQIVNDEEYTDENLLDKSIETFKNPQHVV